MVEILEAHDVITNDEVPTTAISTKPDSTLVKSFLRLKTDEECVGMISAGSTGAVLTGAILKLGRIRGINRPALCPMLPTVTGGQVLLIDCGANSECKPQMLEQFGEMGTAYAKTVLGIENPRVAVLANGTEDKKGTELTHEAFKLLSVNPNVNFVDNMEARDILSGNYDVVVTDGFSGNIALKGCEGTAVAVFDLLKQGVKEGGIRAALGALLLKPVFRKLKHKMDYSENGGAAFLGVIKPVVKAHGSSKAKSVCAAIMQVKRMVDNNVTEQIKQYLPKL
jgi:glycerol-3-phosphate acyltransferase PlsX